MSFASHITHDFHHSYPDFIKFIEKIHELPRFDKMNTKKGDLLIYFNYSDYDDFIIMSSSKNFFFRVFEKKDIPLDLQDSYTCVLNSFSYSSGLFISRTNRRPGMSDSNYSPIEVYASDNFRVLPFEKIPFFLPYILDKSIIPPAYYSLSPTPSVFL